MKRWMFTILSALSLLLFVAVVVLWVRSLFVGDTFFRHFCEDEGEYTMWVQDTVKVGWGGVGFNRVVQAMGPRGDRRAVAGLEKRYGPWKLHETTKAEYPHFNFGIMDEAKLGFKWGRFQTQAPGRGPNWGVQVVVPFWAILLLVGLPTFLLVRRCVVLGRRRRIGLCPSCGYDLRATPGRCPECGWGVPGEAVARGVQDVR